MSDQDTATRAPALQTRGRQEGAPAATARSAGSTSGLRGLTYAGQVEALRPAGAEDRPRDAIQRRAARIQDAFAPGAPVQMDRPAGARARTPPAPTSAGARTAAGGPTAPGGAPQSAADQVIEQLNDAALWRARADDIAASSNLESLLSLAVSQGNAGAAYSIAVRLHTLESHRAVLVRAGVIDAAGHMADPRPQPAEGPSFGEGVEGAAYAVDRGVALAGRAEDSPEHYNLSNIRLDELANGAALGDRVGAGMASNGILGAVSAAGQRGRVPVRVSAVDADQERRHVNTMSVEVHQDGEGGRLNLTIPSLALEQLNMMVGGATVTAPHITTGTIRIQATWPTQQNPRAQLGLSLNLQEFAVDHLSYLNGGSTIGATRLGFASLMLRAREVPESVRNVRNVEQAAGAVREVLIEGAVTRFLASRIVEQLMNTAGDVLGAAHRAGGEGAAMPGGVTMDVRGFFVDGLSTPSGMHAQRVEVDNIHVQTEHLRAAVARMRQAQLQTRLGETTARLGELGRSQSTDPVEAHERTRLEALRPQLQSQLDEIQRTLPALDAEDNEFLGLSRRAPGAAALTPRERTRLQALQATRTARAAIDVDRVSVTGAGLHTGEDTGTLEIQGAHAMTDASGRLGNPFPSGQAPAPEQRGAQSSGGPVDAELSINRVRATNLNLGLPNYRQQAEQKTRLEAQGAGPNAQLSEADRLSLDGLRALWARAVPNDSGRGTYGAIVTRLVEIDVRGDEALRRDWAAQTERDRLRHALSAYATTIGTIDIRGIGLQARGTQATSDAGATRGAAFAGEAHMQVGELDARNVRSGPDTGVDRAYATGVRGDAALMVTSVSQRDLYGRTTASANRGVLNEGHVEAEQVRAEGVRGPGGQRVGRIEADGLRVDASTERGDGTIELHLRRLAAFDVSVPARVTRLEEEATQLRAAARPTAEQTARLQALTAEIGELRALPGLAAAQRATLTRLAAEQQAARTPAQRAAIARRLSEAQEALERLETRLNDTQETRTSGATPAVELNGIDARATGLGNFVDDQSLADRDIDFAFDLGAVHVGTFGIRTAEREFAVSGGGLTGLRVGVALHVGRGEGQSLGARIAPRRLRTLHVTNLNVQGLHMRFPSASGEVDLRLPQATIDGVDAENLPLDGIESFIHPTQDGHFQIAHAEATLRARLGQYIQARASLTIAQNLRLGITHSGQVRFDPGNLTIEASAEAGGRLPAGTDPNSLLARIRGAGGELHVRNLQTATQVDTNTGRITATGPIGMIGVSNLHFTTGGANLRVGDASFENIDIDAQIDTDPAVLAARARGQESSAPLVRDLVFRRFDVQRIVGNNLHYDDPGSHTNVDLAHGSLGGIHVTGFNPRTQAFRIAAGRGRGGPALQLDGLAIARAGLGELRGVSARIASLTVARANNGTLEAAVSGIEADGNGRGASGSTGGSARVHLGARDGLPTSASLSMDRAGNVSASATLGELSVNNLMVDNGANFSLSLGQASLRGLHAAARIHTPPNTEDRARTVSYDFDLNVGSVGITRANLHYDDLVIDLPQDATIRGLYAERIHIEINEGAPNAQRQRESTVTSVSGVTGLTGASLADTSMIIPRILSGHGSLNAGALRVDILSRQNQDFTLDFIRLNRSDARVARIWRIAGMGVGASAQGSGIRGALRGAETDIEIDRGRIGLESSGRGGQLEQRGEAPASGSQLSLELPVLDQLDGTFALTLWDGIIVPIPITRGHIAFDASHWDLPAMPQLPGPFAGLEQRLGRARMLQSVRAFVNDVAYGLDRALGLRHRVEQSVMDTLNGRTEASAATDLGRILADTLQTSSVATAFTEFFTPHGQGLGGIARTWVDQQIIGRVDPQSARYMAANEQRRREAALRDWISHIRIDGIANANGPFRGQSVDPQHHRTTFRGTLQTGFAIHGSLAEHLNATLSLHGSGIQVATGNTTVTIAGADLEAAGSASDRNEALRGGGGAAIGVRGVGIHNRAATTTPR